MACFTTGQQPIALPFAEIRLEELPVLTHPFVLAGIVLGMGLGGFFDGIVLHQILQWHHLVCITEHCQPTSIEHLQRQNQQDGFFHLGTLALTALGSYWVFCTSSRPDTPRSPLVFFGAVLCGWGLFNLVEGLIDHQLLGIHHVLPGSPYQLIADLLFLGSGVAMVAVGWFCVHRAFERAGGAQPGLPRP